MADDPTPIFDSPQPQTEVATRRIGCDGAPAPHNHPRIYLNIGASGEVRCPYCGTLFVYKGAAA